MTPEEHRDKAKELMAQVFENARLFMAGDGKLTELSGPFQWLTVAHALLSISEELARLNNIGDCVIEELRGIRRQ